MRRSLPYEVLERYLVICVQIVQLILCRKNPFHILTRQIPEMLLLKVVQPLSKLVLLLFVPKPHFLLCSILVCSHPRDCICQLE